MVHRSGASARHLLRTLTLTSTRVGQYRSRRVMAGEVSKPHDHLFRSVFREESEAAGLLRAHLPEAVNSELLFRAPLATTTFRVVANVTARRNPHPISRHSSRRRVMYSRAAAAINPDRESPVRLA